MIYTFIMTTIGFIFISSCSSCLEDLDNDNTNNYKSPCNLVQHLGEPNKVIQGTVSPGPTETINYLYYFLDNHGNVQSREYCYNKKTLAWETTFLSETNPNDIYLKRVLDKYNPKDAALILKFKNM